MTILRANTISGLGTDGPVFDGSLEFNSQNYVILPKGTTDNRVGLGSTAGALRYNTDSNKVELWDGNQWVEVQSSRPDLNGGARGVFIAGQTPITAIDYINIAFWNSYKWSKRPKSIYGDSIINSWSSYGW